jgi:hypothetical protein
LNPRRFRLEGEAIAAGAAMVKLLVVGVGKAEVLVRGIGFRRRYKF